MSSGFGISSLSMKRTIRSHIIAACDKLSVSLPENSIQNMINNRMKEVGKEIAVGGSSIPVNWEDRVRATHKSSVEVQRLMEEYRVTAKIHGDD